MVEFGVNILTTQEWNPGAHLHNDRGRYIRQMDGVDTLPGGARSQSHLDLLPIGGADGWTYAFAGTAGNINGDMASPFTADPSNNLINFTPAVNTLQSAVSCVVKPVGAPGARWRTDFTSRMTTFRGGIRLMDLCATQSDYTLARDPASAGSCSVLRRKCPRTFGNGGATQYLWHNDGAWSLDEILNFGEVSGELHFCVPPILLRSENMAQLVIWLTAIANIPGLTRAWIEASNEVWNLTLGNAPYAKFVLDEALRLGLGTPGYHWIVAMAEHYARTAMGLKVVCDSISSKLVTILAWQSTNLDPWVYDHWTRQIVNKYCYEALNTIGHMFIAPYFKTPDIGAVTSQWALINQWRAPHPGGNDQYHADLDRRGVVLHAYEAGCHYDDPSIPVSEQTSATTLGLWDVYLRGLHERMAPNARVYLYGLAGPWAAGNAWGLVEDISLAVPNVKWDQVKSTIEAIRFLQPVDP